MGEPTKVTVEEAVDKATSELSTSEGEVETPAAEPTPETTPTEETPAGDEPVETPSEEEAAPSESETLIDSTIRKSLERYDLGGSPEKTEGKDTLTSLIVNHLKKELSGTGAKSGPLDISQVDTNDPKSVQGYVDSRITHTINAALAPLQRKISLYDADSELRGLLARHPDAPKYGKRIASMIERNPSLDLETAYRAVVHDDLIKTGVKKAYDNMGKKKAANLTTSTVRSPVESSKKPKTSREAVLMALEETGAEFESA